MSAEQPAGYSRGLAVPYNRPERIAEREPNGDIFEYGEVFDRGSFTDLPDRIRVVRGHRRDDPLGWGLLSNENTGLYLQIAWLDSQAGRDAFAEVRAGLLTGLSVGFRANPGKDEVTRRDGELPVIRRRRAVLQEVSLVAVPAYPTAKITDPGSAQTVTITGAADPAALLVPAGRAAAPAPMTAAVAGAIGQYAVKQQQLAADKALIERAVRFVADTRAGMAKPPTTPAGEIINAHGRRYRVNGLHGEAAHEKFRAAWIESHYGADAGWTDTIMARHDIVPAYS